MTDIATASTVMNSIRLQTDTVNDPNITDAYLLELVDKSYGKLYKQIALRYAGFFDVEDTSISLVSGTRFYNLPATFMHLRGVDLVQSDGDRVKLSRLNFGDRDQLSNDPRYVPQRLDRQKSYYRYMTQANTLRIEPVPTSTESLVLTYVPRPTRITSSSDTFDVIAGFEDFIVYDASIQVLAKQERDPTTQTGLRQDALQTIIEICSPRETGDAISVRDNVFGEGVIGWVY